MAIQASTLDKLSILEALYRRGYQSDLIERALNKLLILEQERAQREVEELQARLQAFEAKYQMSSDDFYHRYEKGELDDSADFMEWSSFCDMAKFVKGHLEWLSGKLN